MNWEQLYYAVAGGSILVAGFAALVGLVVTSREQRISLLGEAIAGAVATLVVPLYMLFSGGRLALWLLLPAALLGLALGAGRGFTLPLRITATGRVAGRHSRLLLLCWGGALLLGQLAPLSGVGLLVTLALLALVLTSSAQIGVHAVLLLRRLVLFGNHTTPPLAPSG